MNARLMGRAAAGVGALVAAGAVTLVVVGGTANAAGTGRCTDNVNVRESPDITSEIVAVCERGQAVQVGKTAGRLRPADRPRRLGGAGVRVGGRPRAAPPRRVRRRRRRSHRVRLDRRRRGDGHHVGGATDRRGGPRPTTTRPTTHADDAASSRSAARSARCSADGGGGAGARAPAPPLFRAFRAARPRRPTRGTRATPSSPVGSSVSLPSAPSSHPALSATSNAVPSPTALTTSRSQPLRASLARPWCSASPVSSPVSAAKPTTTWPGSRAATSSTSTSGFCVSASGGGSSEPDFLILWSASDGGPEVRDRGRHHDGVRALGRGVHGVAQLQRRPDPHAPRRPRGRRGRPCAPRRA